MLSEEIIEGIKIYSIVWFVLKRSKTNLIVWLLFLFRTILGEETSGEENIFNCLIAFKRSINLVGWIKTNLIVLLCFYLESC